MAFLQGYKYDVFLSYARVDNVPRSGQTQGWVSKFRDELASVLNRKMGRQEAEFFYDGSDLDGNEQITPAIRDALSNCAIFVGINSEGFLHPKCYCRHECRMFVEILGGKKAAAEKNRAFVVHTLDASLEGVRESWQDLLYEDVLGYNFYTRISEEKRIERLGDYDSQREQFGRAVESLADDISKKLKFLAELEKGTAPVPPASDPAKVIFLAECSVELDGESKRIRDFLVQNGWTVVPSEAGFREGNEEPFTKAVSELIEKQKPFAFVQLLTGSPIGRVPYDVIQYKLAEGVPRFRWRDASITKDNLKEAIREARWPFISGNDVQTHGMEEFMQNLGRELDSLVRDRALSNRSAERKANTLQLLIAAPQSERDRLAQEMEPHFDEQQIGYWFASESDPLSEMAEKWKCRGILVIYGNTTPAWVQERLKDCRTFELGGKDGERIVGVLITPPPDKPLLGKWGTLCKLQWEDWAGFSSFIKSVSEEAA